MYVKKIEGERIYLSPMNVEDAPLYTKWVNDESLASGLGNYKLYMSEVGEKNWLQEQAAQMIHHNYAVIRKEDDMLLGNYGLELKDAISHRYHVGGFIGEKENRGKGYGSEALQLISKYAFEVLNAHTLYSGIFAFTKRLYNLRKNVDIKLQVVFEKPIIIKANIGMKLTLSTQPQITLKRKNSGQ